MGAREIMAGAILGAGKAMGALAHKQASTFEDKIVAFQVEALTAAGYRILAPGELDRATVERTAEVATERALGRERLFNENGASINAAKAVEAEEIAHAIRTLTDGGHDA